MVIVRARREDDGRRWRCIHDGTGLDGHGDATDEGQGGDQERK
jgi:hypothetical protein